MVRNERHFTHKNMSNTHGLLIKISDCGDAAKVTIQ
jgi:hypothetical protein